MSSFRADRMWMYNRLVPSRKGVTYEFLKGVDGFIEFALTQHNFVSNGNIRCPCSNCTNIEFLEPYEVKAHLYKHGFVSDYYQWESHGEPFVPISRSQSSIHVSNEISGDTTPVNPYRDMVIDAIGHSMNFDYDEFDLGGEEEQAPNQKAQDFFDMLKAAEEPLFTGCVNHSKLSAVCRLLNIKSEFNMSESCYNQILLFLKELLPEDSKLPKDFYRTKQMVAKLGLGYEKIDVCMEGCILYYKDNKDETNCPKCGHPRYKPKKGGNGRQKNIPYKVLRYFPITPRLQRLYMSTKTAEHMTWHYKSRREPGVMSHPSDGEAWKKFDQDHPSFASEHRNVRLGLSADGFSPFGHTAHPYSCWPVIITPYNLPPGMCMSSPYMFLSLLIPGPKSPGKNIDLYLQPLIDELKQLWESGVDTYDAYRKQNFQMRAALMWTISDFPAYGMLSGWSTHGLLSCPCCMDKTKTFYLKHGRKASFFDCHRQFLPTGHSFRRDKKSFYKGRVERSNPPPRLSSEEVWNKVCDLPKIFDDHASDKLPGFGVQHNWTKKSIFWDLPYWRTNLIRHNLDPMHIERNVFENIFNTVMDVKGKTKDNLNARRDVKIYCDRPELELKENQGRILKPKAAYSLTKDQKKLVCEWVKNLRLPDGYASNLSKCVDMEERKLSRMKSHDCHVFLERLMPIAFRELLPEPIWNILTEVSLFFKGLCATVVKVEDLQKLEEGIKLTTSKLCKIFPPGFFDPMEHLPIHLPYEAIVGGPVQYRWMYPFERTLHDYKKKAKNKGRVEGSICEAYIIQEISTFCSHYFEPNVPTRLNKVTRNDDGDEVDAPDGCLSIFLHPGRSNGETHTRYLSDEEFDAARLYVLLNCEEVQPYVLNFEAELRRNSANISLEQIDKETTSRFAKWFEAYVLNPANNIVDERLINLACGPYKRVQTWPQYFTNGYRFDTITHGSNKSTMNSGVCIKGKSWSDYESDYYGLLVDVIELEYSNPTDKRTTLVLFKCDWFDPTMNRGMKVHNRYGLIDINHKKRFLSYTYEPFVLAEQAQQVYFAEYPSKKNDKADWWAVCKVKARSRIDSPNIPYQEDEGCPASLPNEIDDLDCLLHEDNEVEEHAITEDSTEIGRAHNSDAVESEKEMEESDFESSKDEGDEYSEDDDNE